MIHSPALRAALAVEIRKTAASSVTLTTTLLLVLGIAALATVLEAAAAAGNQQILAQLGPVADLTGWARFMGIVSQITAAGGLLGLGVGLGWMFGREFSDGTVSGLFALPVPRATIAVAKLITHTLWTTLVALAWAIVVLILGLSLDLGPTDAATAEASARLFGLVVLSGFLAWPTAWAATIGRGVLPAVAATVVLVVIAQVSILAGAGGWSLVGTPALWAIGFANVTAGQLALTLLIPLTFGTLALRAWHRLELDR